MLTTQPTLLSSIRLENQNRHYHSTYTLQDISGVKGEFSLYDNPLLKYKQHRVVCVGDYFCVDDNTMAQQLIKEMDKKCKELGYTYIIGPMNGSTWESYRFSIESNQKTFTLDRAQPLYYNRQFKANGFVPIGAYYSSIDTTLTPRSTQITEDYWNKKTLTIRNIRLSPLKEELYKIAVLTNAIFKDNFLFTPIQPELFVIKYLQLQPILDPQYIYIAENPKGQMLAYIFAYLDPLDDSEQTLVIKTIAVSHTANCRGLGGYLAERVIATAKENGIKKIIHAFMHKNNISLNTSRHYGQPYKTYALYGKNLQSYKDE